MVEFLKNDNNFIRHLSKESYKRKVKGDTNE